jgi:hypothetical protein
MSWHFFRSAFISKINKVILRPMSQCFDLDIQPNSVIMNRLGQEKFVRYKRGSIQLGLIIIRVRYNLIFIQH